jgi:DNA-binding GntR family transcriptional regulator
MGKRSRWAVPSQLLIVDNLADDTLCCGMQAPIPGTPVLSRPQGKTVRLRTTVEQIADGLGIAILQGEYAAGERIGEQDVADRYGVSRGPVREALRTLASRGLVELEPRRGAFAIGISLDIIADFFNVRGSLMGLAARCFTRTAAPAGLAEFDDRLATLKQRAAQADPVGFAEASGRAGGTLYRHCGNPYLAKLLRDQVHNSLWGLIWNDRPLDFTTGERRRAMLRLWQAVALAARRGEDARAEILTRRILIESRDAALQTLAKARASKPSQAKLITWEDAPPCNG